MAAIFNQKLLKNAMEKFSFPTNDKRKKIDGIIQAWQTSFRDHDLSKAKETSLQGKFFSKFFCEILGYTMQDDGFFEWTLKQEAKTEVDGKEADGSLGFYSKEKEQTRVVIELKDAQCNLDTKQCSRENKQTPVEQAFQYLYKFADCDWVIVSNFRYTRLYHKSKGQTAYEEFDILKLNEEKEFKRFYFCLCRENLINEQANSPMDLLIKQSGESDIDITKEFYSDFKKVRKILFEHIVENNPDYDKKLLLEKTQKLLDRFIFIFFCEDTAGLLPHNTVENIYKNAKNSYSMSKCRIWDEFRGLFAAIDKGNNNVNPPINAYNGGLFAPDEILDKLLIKDEVFEHIKKLSRYDFESDLNVNILGHIFEQSLSDLEHLKNEIDGIQEDKKNSKRKKDGIFYTPEYITHYIVEETIGRYLDENPDKLETIKILDPACGSGAFLNQAHEFLRKQHKIKIEEKINAEKSSKRGGQEFLQTNLLKHSNLAENDRSILLNNIFGVDLNKESVEITKLALWLKTAHPKYKLQNLDENIKCGNSLIDDPNIAGEKAFKWENEFKDVMDNGGFDAIIGNPPYGVTFNDEEKKYLTELDNNVPDFEIYIYFVSRAINLLKDGGIVSFIFPNTFLSILYGQKYREWILENFEILSVVDLSNDNTFEDASVRTCIFTIKKIKKTNEVNFIRIDNNTKEFKISNKIDYDTLRKSLANWLKLLDFDPKVQSILEKISSKSHKLNDLCEISQGLIPYDKYRGHSEETIKNRIWHADYKKDDTYKKELQGGDVKSYFVHWNGKNWISYGDWLAAPRKPEFFKNERLLIREIVNDRLLCAYTNEEFYNNPSIINIINTKNDCNLKYILAIINSKLMTWYHINTSPKAKKGLFPKILINDVRNLPIITATNASQQSLAEKAEKMIELNKKLYEESQKSLELIELEYKPKKISQKLENFYTLGLNPFLDELQKQGVKLSLSQKEDLIGWYKSKSELLNGIKTQIETLDKEIDKEVYKLYGLTEDEIKIIEGV